MSGCNQIDLVNDGCGNMDCNYLMSHCGYDLYSGIFTEGSISHLPRPPLALAQWEIKRFRSCLSNQSSLKLQPFFQISPNNFLKMLHSLTSGVWERVFSGRQIISLMQENKSGSQISCDRWERWDEPAVCQHVSVWKRASCSLQTERWTLGAVQSVPSSRWSDPLMALWWDTCSSISCLKHRLALEDVLRPAAQRQ